MRYRLMATYRGVPYEAGAGPAASVVLYAACPPPEELGFQPAPGHWRKWVARSELDALWESRPVGSFRGEPCLVLDDLGDRLHLAYLGTDPQRAAHLGYWQVDRGVFELLGPRAEVTGLTEERAEWPLSGSGPDPVTGEPGRGRAARRQPVTAREVFCDLADLAAIPRHAYALETETDGAMCLLSAGDGYEVFVAAGGARREVRTFGDEETAYFYLFGVLAADAIRSGGLIRR